MPPVHGYGIEVTRAQQGRVPAEYERKQTLATAERFTTPELRDVERTVLGANDSIDAIARFVSGDVYLPDDWGCCAYAGDRGLLHPELTASATAREAAEITSRDFAAYASANRTCELGMTQATGRPYVHILELLESATR